MKEKEFLNHLSNCFLFKENFTIVSVIQMCLRLGNIVVCEKLIMGTKGWKL
jgi:hypothetical protein